MTFSKKEVQVEILKTALEIHAQIVEMGKEKTFSLQDVLLVLIESDCNIILTKAWLGFY